MKINETDLVNAVSTLIDGLFIIGGGYYDNDKLHAVQEMDDFLSTFEQLYPQIKKSWTYEHFYNSIKPEVEHALKDEIAKAKSEVASV